MSNLAPILQKLEECQYLIDKVCVQEAAILEMLDLQEAKISLQRAFIGLMRVERDRRKKKSGPDTSEQRAHEEKPTETAENGVVGLNTYIRRGQLG